jgi:GT2 family glycosyltransferase
VGQRGSPLISIIIVTWNCRDYVLRCLETIYTNTGFDFETIVWDNNSTDNTCQAISETYPAVKLLNNGQNIGFARANNETIKHARGKYLLLLNPDTEMFSTTLADLVKMAKVYDDQAMIVPTLLNSDGTLQPSRHSFLTIDGIAKKILVTIRRLLGQELPGSKLHVDWAIGACWLIPRDIHQAVGELDGNLFMYGEDWDYCLQVHKAGFEIMWAPQIQVIHHGNVSGQQKWGDRRLIKGHQAVIYFWLKNFSLPYAIVMIIIRMVYILAKTILTMNRELLWQGIALAQACLDKNTWRLYYSTRR